MLKSLYISNYALITELHIDFESGLSVITGETGAGKSIMLGALALILGQRADTRSIKTGADKCIIEAEFDISAYQHLTSFFNENDIDCDGKYCLIRREITSAGKSRAFVNDSPAQLTTIRDLSNRLLDIHSQHENLLLSNATYQLEVVDTIAQNAGQLSKYQLAWHQWKDVQHQLKSLKHAADKQTADIDYIRFQFTQLSEANLLENEQEELEAEQEILAHAEEIKTELSRSLQLVSDEQMALSLLKEAMNAVAKIKGYVPEGDDWYERMHSAYVDVKEIASELSAYEERVEFNPVRLEWVENRLSELFTLQKKYKVLSVKELISVRDEFAARLKRIDSYDEELERLEKELESLQSKMQVEATLLSETRRKASAPIEKYLVEQLMKLGIPNIRFQVAVASVNEYTESGNDEVLFLFSANKNRELQPVTQIASGGEIARVMLSIKALVAHRADLPTIIFDEIDTGVSGEIAHRMGEIMQTMAEDMQVITITHLPQIAGKGKTHFRVYKDDSGEQTQTFIERLSAEDRIRELAQMLSGRNITDAALLNARELLKGR